MRRSFVAVSTLLLIAGLASAGGPKEYPLTLTVFETNAISSKLDGTRITTTCTSTPGVEEITCDSRQIAGATHTDLVSYAAASDGKAYLIQCTLGVGRGFLVGAGQAMAANAGTSTVSGCRVPPGTYKARWEKDHLKVLHEKNGKFKETTFAVLSSVPIPAGNSTEAGGEKTVLKLSSTPTGADIELDGSFVGQTPSSLLALPGEHSIRITKSGYKVWERKIKTSGGEVTLSPELISER